MKKLIIFFATALLAGCADWQAVNKDPGRPNQPEVGVDAALILFPDMIDRMHNWQENRSQMNEQMIWNQYGGYMVPTNRFNGTNYGTFNAQSNWIDSPWNDHVGPFYVNYFQVRDITGDTGWLMAWANVIRAAVMLRVVDTFGPIPYSKVSPDDDTWEYDSVRDVYHAMIADLTAAIPVLGQGGSPNARAYDQVYGGDFGKWVRLANSLRLRMAVRIALVDTEYAKGVMADAIAGGCIESNSDNAFTPTHNNPYRLSSVDWADLGANATLSTYLAGWNDPRREVYLTAGNDDNYLGVRPGINYDGDGKAIYAASGNYAKPNFSPSSPMLVFCAAETYFLRAEAALRGWIAGDARSLYEQGIAASMQQHGVALGGYLSAVMTPAGATHTDARNPANSFADLISAAGGTPLAVSWDALSTDEMRVEAIVTQKWLANYPYGSEGWADFRRTGYPRMLPALDNLSSPGTGGMVFNPVDNLTGAIRLARRLPYPPTERNNNGTNVQAAVSGLLGGPDEYSTELWWAKGRQ